MMHAGSRLHRRSRWLEDPSRSLHSIPRLVHHAAAVAAHLGPVLVIVAVGAYALGSTIRGARGRNLARDARIVEIGVPPKVEFRGAVLLWSALHDLLVGKIARLLIGQPHLAWEIFSTQDGTTIRLWIPDAIPGGLIERAVASAWPGASTNIRPARDLANEPATIELGAELVLSGPTWFSLNCNLDPDPVPLILGQLAGLTDEQHVLVQILARPASRRDQHRLRAAARHIRAGKPTGLLARAFDELVGHTPSKTAVDPTISPDVRDVLDKTAQPLFRCLVRIAVTASSRSEARGRLDAVLGGFAPYEGRVGLRRRRVRKLEARISERQLGRRAFLASTNEVAALAHLPSELAIPGLVRASARKVAMPPGPSAGGKPLGVSAGRKVHLAVADARQHLHILGPTGVGKSTLIARLVLADFHERRGAVVIDPKGDLVEDVLARIPEGREGDVDLLDPLDPAPLTMNMLDNPDRDLGVDQLVAIFKRVFERDWGPRTDDIFRAALLTLTANGRQATLADVPVLLSDSDWQEQLISGIDDRVGLGPFWNWYRGLSEGQRASSTGPLLNKLRVFLLRRPVRAIISSPKTTLDIRRCLDEGRLLLARLPKGTLGEETSRLLGSMVVARTWQAALARAGLRPENRPDSTLYIDEVQNYLNLPTPIPDVLAEARGYRLSLCMAHQHLGQLTPELREGISANARTKIYFQLSTDDAHHLEADVSPELTEYDLAHLDPFTAAVRLCCNGHSGRPFTLNTEVLAQATVERATAVRATIAAQTHARTDDDDADRDPGDVPRQRQPFDRRRRYQALGDPGVSRVVPSDLGSDLGSDLRAE
jgi:hypothetical protein